MGAWVGPVLAGLSGLSGLFGNKKQVSDTNYNQSTTPNYDPTNLAFRDQLIKLFSDRASGEGSQKFENAYRTAGLKNLFTTNQNVGQGISDMLTARGIGRTTAGGSALADTSYRAGSNTADFLNNIPLIMDQRNFQNLAAAGSYQAGLPVGTNTSGTSHTVGNVGPTSPAAGLFSGAASGLAGYLGQLSANNNFSDVLKKIGQQNYMPPLQPADHP